MPKITKKVVDSTATAPSGGQVFVWDSELKGFGLRVTGAGVKSFVMQYRTANGQTRRHTIGKFGSPWTAESARDEAFRLLREIAAGNDPLEAKARARKALTVGQLVDLYLEEGPIEKPNKKASTWEIDASNLRRHVVPLIGRKVVKSLRPSDIAKLQVDIAAGKSFADEKTKPRGRAIVRGGKGTAARAVGTLAAMLNFALERGLIEENPAARVKLFAREKKERFLTDAEVTRLADTITAMEAEAALNASMATAVRLLMLTGCRKSEILTLKWEWVDFERSCLRLPDSKTGAKVVPLASAALEILAGLSLGEGDDASPWVLPASKGEGPIVGIQKAWGRVRERAGLPGLRLHDLRHSFASFAVADGASLYMIGKVLGHKQARTTEIYAHVRDDPLKAVADRTADRIASAMRRKPAPSGLDKVVPLRGR